MDRAAFLSAYGELYEHSPWVAEGAWERRPFGDAAGLRSAFEAAVRAAPRERRLALIGAHPELAGSEAAAGELTAASESEQARAGLDRLSAEQLAAIQELNRAYRERFGLPFVTCVREHASLASLLDFGRERLGNEPGVEEGVALEEVLKIGALRLGDLDSAGSPTRVVGDLAP